MQALIQALISRITGDAELTAILGTVPAVYLTEAPESAGLPLVIVRVTPGHCAHDFSGDRLTVVNVAIEVIAADVTVALSGAQRLEALLDNATFPLTAGSLLSCRQTTPMAPVMPGFNALQTALYTAEIHVECQVFDAA